ASAGLLEVPGGIDRAPAGSVEPLRLVLLVVGPERAAADRPRELPDRTFLDQLARPRELRAQHLTRRRDDAKVARPGEVEHRVRLGDSRAHRLVQVDGLACR